MKHLMRFAVLVLALGVTPSFAQESPSFVMDRITFSSAAQQATSASFEMSVTFAQEGLVGSASLCNQGYVQNFGFWSVMGYSPIPVMLRAARNTANPFDVDLSWTGSATSFEIYRSTIPNGIIDPPNLAAVTSECSDTDTPPNAPIVFYLVVPANP
jgi:hypothetical protein